MELSSSNEGLSQDIIGYIIEFCPVTVAVRLRCCCKSFSTTFVWNNIRYFDNGDYSADESDRVLETLLANVAHLRRFEMVNISQKVQEQSQDLYNKFIIRIVPQLSRIKRKIYTLFIKDETELLKSLNPRILMDLHLSAFTSSRMNTFFRSHESFDALRDLIVSQDEPDDYDEYYEPLGMTEDTESVRPLLRTLAARTNKLESLSVCVTNLKDEDGFFIDDIKRLVEANRASLNIFDFSANRDNLSEKAVLRAPTTMDWLDFLFQGAVKDPSKWRTLPDAVREKFGIDINKFRILGYTLWQMVVHDYMYEGAVFPPLEAMQELYKAVYPSERTSCGARVKAFEVLLRPALLLALKQASEEPNDRVRSCVAWMASEVRVTLDVFEPHSERLNPTIIGLISVIYAQHLIGSSYEELWERLREILNVANRSAPLVAVFDALDEHEDLFHAPPSKLAEFIIQESRGMKIDLFARIGHAQWPLGPMLRQCTPTAFCKLIHDPQLFDPLARDPSRNIPSVVFHICFPGFQGHFYHPVGEKDLPALVELFEIFNKVESQLGEFRYETADHLASLMKSVTGSRLIVTITKILHPVDFTNESIVKAIPTAALDFDTLLPDIVAKIQRHKDGPTLLGQFSELCWQLMLSDGAGMDTSVAAAFSRHLTMPPELKIRFGIS